MASVKAALKAAKAALDAAKYGEAIDQAEVVLAADPQNYFAKLFLGRALDKQGKPDDAIKVYESATKIRPNDDQAWLGLRALYEDQGHKKLDELLSVSMKLAEIYAAVENSDRCHAVVNKLITVAQTQGSKLQYKRALEFQSPSSPIYSFLEGKVPHPSHTYLRLAEISEALETERINKEIGERRTRLGARIAQVTTEVKREVYSHSDLKDIYQNVIDWATDDDIRRQYEEKLLKRLYDTLLVLPASQKPEMRELVQNQAKGMVIIKHPFALAWEIELEWKDAESFSEWTVAVLREFIEFFPDHGLSKVLKGFLNSELSPFPPQPKEEGENDEEEKESTDNVKLSPEDCLLLMSDGLDDSKEFILAHRLLAEYYLYLEEYESSVEMAKKALKLLSAEKLKTGIVLELNTDAINSILATSFIHYQSPKNHPEAKAIFSSILERKPNFNAALIGLGLIFEEEEEYPKAIEYLMLSLARDPTDFRIGAETAWCKALNGDYPIGLEELEMHLSQMNPKDIHLRELRALTLYRIGICMWNIDCTRAARKDRSGAYARFLSAIKTNVNFAPAYTSLGVYYADYAKDKRRARQCFQKAFELSSSEIEAAERLARLFADQGDWDIVEAIAQRAVDSGKLRPAPGSKKKGVSWPFSALGIVQMNRQDYAKSITSFLSALRISPGDYNAYVGLGESYHNSGRYNSAARAFRYAEDPTDGVQMKNKGEVWFTKYMLANVNRELGQYDDAINGYHEVLKSRPKEFGVSIALLQTLIEKSWRNIELGFFGQAADNAKEAIDVANGIVDYKPNAFNLWKAVGDAYSIYSWVQSRIDDVPLEISKRMLENKMDTQEYDTIVKSDGVGQASLESLSPQLEEGGASKLERCMMAAILAHKRAVWAATNEIHAQAVAWYNLGWTELRAHICLDQDIKAGKLKQKKYLKASVLCFKRAIELEAGNSEFWNALGVVTAVLNVKVSQHSFVRSLHLNERSAKTWTNLGTLYLLQNDLELAHAAFNRAQSTEPEYAQAWLGEGIVSLLWGDTKEALSHFTHAFEISDSKSVIVKRQYALSTFDFLLTSSAASDNIINLTQPIFALHQLYSQTPSDTLYYHLAALYLERVRDYSAAVSALKSICAAAESDYEITESNESLFRFAQAKADVARNNLATKNYVAATEDAETALDLTSDLDVSILDTSTRKSLRLSARLTAGLARYYLSDTDESIAHFRACLEDSDGAPDVVCLLAEVLWAKGGENEKSVARDQLFECMERHPEHTGTIFLLGAMAVLDEDIETMEAVKGDLDTLRTKPGLTENQYRRSQIILGAIAALSSKEASARIALLREIQTSIILSPTRPHAWAQLTEAEQAVEEQYPQQMAKIMAERAVPPKGTLGAEELAKVVAGTGSLGDAQRAIALAPWIKSGWVACDEILG